MKVYFRRFDCILVVRLKLRENSGPFFYKILDTKITDYKRMFLPSKNTLTKSHCFLIESQLFNDFVTLTWPATIVDIRVLFVVWHMYRSSRFSAVILVLFLGLFFSSSSCWNIQMCICKAKLAACLWTEATGKDFFEAACYSLTVHQWNLNFKTLNNWNKVYSQILFLLFSTIFLLKLLLFFYYWLTEQLQFMRQKHIVPLEGAF